MSLDYLIEKEKIPVFVVTKWKLNGKVFSVNSFAPKMIVSVVLLLKSQDIRFTLLHPLLNE